MTTTGRRSSSETPRLGARVRALRRRAGVTQATMAEKLGISPSYLNLIEADKRPLPADLLIRLAREFHLDLATFASDEDARTIQDLQEVFADPLFEETTIAMSELRDLVQYAPDAARGVVTLYRACKTAQGQADALGAQLDEVDLVNLDRSRISSEEVSELIQRRMNHFPEIEAGAERLWEEARLDPADLYPGLCGYLEREHGIKVRTVDADAETGVLRRFDPASRVVLLSELLPTRSRNFQLAHTIGLLTMEDEIGRIVNEDDGLTVPESRQLAKVALANYFAGAVMMPYERILAAAQKTRYDLDVIGRRFRVSFEQVAHRLTTLRRPGREGVPFHYVRIDVAGNISKRFSASGIRIARFSGACPRWNVFSAFLTPGLIRVQISQMPDGERYFCIARMLHRDAGGFHTQHPVHAIGLGCQLERASELVYAEGMDLTNPTNVAEVGVTCRVCEREDCEQRALPSVRQPLQVDERVRRVSPYAAAQPRRDG